MKPVGLPGGVLAGQGLRFATAQPAAPAGSAPGPRWTRRQPISCIGCPTPAVGLAGHSRLYERRLRRYHGACREGSGPLVL